VGQLPRGDIAALAAGAIDRAALRFAFLLHDAWLQGRAIGYFAGRVLSDHGAVQELS
jgi:hypothetical protein